MRSRGWRATLWDALFDQLLNVPSCHTQANLSVLRRQLESALSVHAQELSELLIQERALVGGV